MLVEFLITYLLVLIVMVFCALAFCILIVILSLLIMLWMVLDFVWVCILLSAPTADAQTILREQSQRSYLRRKIIMKFDTMIPDWKKYLK